MKKGLGLGAECLGLAELSTCTLACMWTRIHTNIWTRIHTKTRIPITSDETSAGIVKASKGLSNRPSYVRHPIGQYAVSSAVSPGMHRAEEHGPGHQLKEDGPLLLKRSASGEWSRVHEWQWL